MYGHSSEVVARLTAWLDDARTELAHDHPAEFAAHLADAEGDR